MRFLLTGFEPFEGVPVNPTQQIVERYGADPKYRGVDLDTLVLPVVLNAWDNVAPLLKNPYDALVHLGADPVNDFVRIERVGLNLDDFRIPDNEGFQASDRTIRVDGETAYLSTLPVKAMVEALEKQGIPAKQSFTAGTYLCNHVMYESLYHVNRLGLDTLSGFIHLPVPDKMDLDTQLRAMRIMLDTMIDSLEEEA